MKMLPWFLFVFFLQAQASVWDFSSPKGRESHVFQGDATMAADVLHLVWNADSTWQHGTFANTLAIPSNVIKRDWKVQFNYETVGNKESGDGFAFVFSESDNVSSIATVFHEESSFRGFALIFDPSDNDHLDNNPAVAGHYYTGLFPGYNHSSDGVSHQLDGCILNFRNSPWQMKSKIVYQDNELAVWLDISGNDDFRLCFQVPNVKWESENYFIGFTARNPPTSNDQYSVGGFTFETEESSSMTSERMENIIVAHSKLDKLMQSNKAFIDSHQLGEALEEAEFNVLRKTNYVADPMHKAIDRIEQLQISLQTSLFSLRKQALPQSIEMLSNIKLTRKEKPGQQELRAADQFMEQFDASCQFRANSVISSLHLPSDPFPYLFLGLFVAQTIFLVFYVSAALRPDPYDLSKKMY